MKSTSYFLIAPKNELRERLSSPDSEGVQSLCDQVLWSGDEYDRSLLHPSDMDTLVKILFLDVLKREQGSSPGFERLFPGLTPKAEYFDSLWTLKRVQVDMTVEDAVEDASISGSLPALAPSGNARIDELLEIARKRGSVRGRAV